MKHHIITPLIITGPTGVGKTNFSLKLAHAVHGEIINCDVGQFYEPLAIGTAKPDWKSETIPHHGFDIITRPENFSVTAYHTFVQAKIEDISARNKMPILVGGSGFYIHALFFPPRDTEVGESVTLHFSDKTTQELWQQLQEIDPTRAAALTPHDRYRIERALSIWYATGKKPSAHKPVYSPLFKNAHIIHLTRDRDELYQRINYRTELMLTEGWIEEVAQLPAYWITFLKTKKLIGYPEIITALEAAHFDKEQITPETYSLLVKTIQQKTRNYAKRQLTLWRMLRKAVELQNSNSYSEFNLTGATLDVYINQLLSRLNKVY